MYSKHKSKTWPEITSIENIKTPGEWMNVRVKILQLWETQSKAISQLGLAADETDKIKFISWEKSNLKNLEKGNTYLLENVIADKYNGKLQLNLNSRTKIRETDHKIETKNDSFEGRVDQIIPKSGYIKRCPKCKRVLVDNHCVVHVDVDPLEDLRIKAKLNTSPKIFILKEKIAEKILGTKISEAKEKTQKQIHELMKEKVLGKKFRFKGNDYGENFNVTEFERIGD